MRSAFAFRSAARCGRQFLPAARTCRAPAAAASATTPQRRGCAAAAAPAQTQLGAYLQACGANWGDAAEAHAVDASEDGKHFKWQVDLPEERLATMRRGEHLESHPFDLVSQGARARLQFFPRGDANTTDEGSCALWLSTDSREGFPVRLRLAGSERSGGSSDFAKLKDVLQNGVVEIGLSVEDETRQADAAAPPPVQQSLQLTGLQLAEWRLFNAADLFKAGKLVSSPPFRFHHVLLGDMYLELQPNKPHDDFCALFFRCRVPTMRLGVRLEVGGGAFSKSFEAAGRSTVEEDLKSGRSLQVNLDAPNVLDKDGSLVVRAALEEVVAIPAALRDMIPRLDERASWPKRL